MSEKEKKKTKRISKNYREAEKSQYIIIVKQFLNCDIIINKIFSYL